MCLSIIRKSCFFYRWCRRKTSLIWVFVNHDRVAARPREIVRTQATLGPTSEKLTSDLALVPAWAAECCPGQAEQWHECSILRSDLQIRTLSYSLIHANNKYWKYLHIVIMFKVEHLVISIFPLLAFSDPPWAKHYKDTPSTVQTSGIFGWLNKHEKQMGQDRNRYIPVPNITKYFENSLSLGICISQYTLFIQQLCMILS